MCFLYILFLEFLDILATAECRNRGQPLSIPQNQFLGAVAAGSSGYLSLENYLHPFHPVSRETVQRRRQRGDSRGLCSGFGQDLRSVTASFVYGRTGRAWGNLTMAVPIRQLRAEPENSHIRQTGSGGPGVSHFR